MTRCLLNRCFALSILLASAAGLAACGNSAKTLLSTGSLFNKNKPDAVAAPPPAAITPTQRAIQVGWVSARATKCGFYFDPAKLKQQYLASEAAGGMQLDQLRKLDLSYQLSLKKTAAKIAKVENYCSEVKTAAIRKDLQRHLTGDFTPTIQKKVVEEDDGWFGLSSKKKGPEKFDPQKAFDPKQSRSQ